MVLLPKANLERAERIADLIRVSFSNIDFSHAPSQTLSLVVTEMIAGETADISCMRADDALYEAKEGGRNRVKVII
jgi:PleD family two-component response regulator